MSKKVKELLKENALESELVEAMNNLVGAHSKIAEIFQKTKQGSRVDEFIFGELNDFYPYNSSCFDELLSEVVTWKKALEMYLESLDVEEIKDELLKY